MDLVVLLEIVRARKHLEADVALVRTLACVHEHVALDVLEALEHLVTVGAAIGLVASRCTGALGPRWLA